MTDMDSSFESSGCFNEPSQGHEGYRPSIGLVVLVSLAFWIALALASPGSLWLTAATTITGVILLGLGQTLLRLLGPQSLRESGALLSLPAGLITFAGLAQASHHLGWSIWPLWVVSVLLAVPGVVLACRASNAYLRKRLPHGVLYIAVIVLVGAIYYLPKSQRESVETQDGAVQWIYPDSAYHEAIAAQIAEERPPLRNPGVFPAVLPFHYGRHALANAITQAFGLPVADSLARSAHWLALLALTSGAISLGWTSARTVAQRPLSGLLAIVLIFLLGSFPAILLSAGDSASRHSQKLLELPLGNSEMLLGLGDTCFIHFIDGASCLWAGVVTIAVVALLIQRAGDPASRRWGFPWLALLLSILGLASNGVAGLCCAATVMALALVENWKEWRVYALLFVAAVLFRLFQHAIGLDRNAPGSAARGVRELMMTTIRLCCSGFFVLFSFRAMGLLTLASGTRREKTVLLLLTLMSCGLYVLLVLEGYPIAILMIALSGFAAGPAAAILQSLLSADHAWDDIWLTAVRWYRRYCLTIMVSAILLLPFGLYPLLRERSLQVTYGFTILLPIIVVCSMALVWAAGRILSRKWIPSRRSAIAMSVALATVSLLGVLRTDLNYGWGWLGNTITLDGGRVASLRFLRDHSRRGALVATTHHDIEVPLRKSRSYAYAALSHRLMLLEGWEYAYYAIRLHTFDLEQVQHDNERLFTTHSPAEARKLIEEYGITHILVEPGESLGFDVGQTPWLRPLPNPGTLGILLVDMTTDSRPPH